MAEHLRDVLHRLDRKNYNDYRDLRGRQFPVGPFQLRFTRIQGDPFAAPSHLRIDVPALRPGLPEWATGTADARRATADWLHRVIQQHLPDGGPAKSRRDDSTKAGHVGIMAIGQEVLDRTAVVVGVDGAVVVRLTIGLPAQGRRILGRVAGVLLCDTVNEAMKRSIRIDLDALAKHVHAIEDQVALRAQLADRHLVGFLAEGATLPRKSGIDDRPLWGAVPVIAPNALAVELEVPHAGTIRGLGIRAGVTVIVGGGYHGKSTVLTALARGIYDHIPGDGRERCVTRADAVSIRAEDGRPVTGVDLRPFIGDLPGGRDTRAFQTADASGSTSQAASIVEALEAGAGALFIDEDTAATNFMIRDARMRRLVPRDGEPITPFIDRVRQLADRGVSSVLVVGGAGDYLDVADTVIRMHDYLPADATAEAKAVAAALPLGEAAPRAPGPWPDPAPRVPNPASLNPQKGRKSERARSFRTHHLEFGESEIDLGALTQLVDPAQTRLIGDALLFLARGTCDGHQNIPELLAAVTNAWADDLHGVAVFESVDRARPRALELAMALNRLRPLTLKDSEA